MVTNVSLTALPRPTFVNTHDDDRQTVATPELPPTRYRQLRSTGPVFTRRTVTELPPVLGTLLATASLASIGTLEKLRAEVTLVLISADVKTTDMALSIPMLTLHPTLLYEVHCVPLVELRPIRPLGLRSHETKTDSAMVKLTAPVKGAFVVTKLLIDTGSRPKLYAQLTLVEKTPAVRTRECATTNPAPTLPRTLLADVHDVPPAPDPPTRARTLKSAGPTHARSATVKLTAPVVGPFVPTTLLSESDAASWLAVRLLLDRFWPDVATTIPAPASPDPTLAAMLLAEPHTDALAPDPPTRARGLGLALTDPTATSTVTLAAPVLGAFVVTTLLVASDWIP